MGEQITKHRVRVFKTLAERPGQWLSAAEVSKLADVAIRTARSTLPALARRGVVEEFGETFGHRYRVNANMNRAASEYARLLNESATVLGE